MNGYVDQYSKWLKKTTKNIAITKKQEGKEFLSRFQSLTLDESMLGALHHVRVLLRITEDFAGDRKNLRWVEKLQSELSVWKSVLNSSIRIQPIGDTEVVDAVIKDILDEETAVELMQHG